MPRPFVSLRRTIFKNVSIFNVNITLTMSRYKVKIAAIALIASLLAGCDLNSGVTEQTTENFNFGWKFIKEDVKGAESVKFDDSSWRDLDLPQDWSIEGPFSEEHASATGYLPGGTGWYRKTFKAPDLNEGAKLLISFDGVYCNSEVYINGTLLGKRPNGYISFQYDLTPYIKAGKKNFIAVRVDHTDEGDSRWYTGSGIYRDVKLLTIPPVHLGQWGVYYTTPVVSAERATVRVEVDVVNTTDSPERVLVKSSLGGGTGAVIAVSDSVEINPGSEKKVILTIEVPEPMLWSVDNPNLYSLLTRVESRYGSDVISNNVGIRTVRFDPDKGFFLNGVNMKLKGVCMHHDAGTLGSAVPKEELARRLDILKELGCNAIRTSHNPFSPDFNNLCDEKGFLVIAEMFDEWELPKNKWIKGWNVGIPGKQGYAKYFKEWAVDDLRDFVMRDRNHPSIIMWSIGNEVDYPNDPYTHQILNTEANPQTWAKYRETLPHADRLGFIAVQLVDVIRKLDTTRPVTAGLASALMSNETGYAEALDVVGYNYQEFRYDADHKKYPNRPLYGSENGMSLEMWEAVERNDYVMGQFLWTGIEYIGEAGRFPARSNTAGLIDLAGNRKPEYYFRQSLWSDKPMVFIGTTGRLNDRGPVSLWAHKRVDPVWNYDTLQVVSINAFTNCEEVELFLNSVSLGSKKRADFPNRTITWELPFEAGELKAVAKNGGVEVAEYAITTAGDAIGMKVESTKSEIKADRVELAHIFVSLVDEKGNLVYSADNEVTCNITGPVKLLGMEDANPSNTDSYKDNKQKAFHGKLLIYLQATDQPGAAVITLSAEGMEARTVNIRVK